MPITLQQLAGLPNLTPGTYSNDVKTLQQWLVENGYMTQSQMNSGIGTYGPQTTAAVASWQSSKGIDTAGNPGYFGPITKTYVNTQIAQSQPTQQNQQTQQNQSTPQAPIDDRTPEEIAEDNARAGQTQQPVQQQGINWSSLYNEYAEKARQNNWTSFWIGSTTDPTQRQYYRKEGDAFIQKANEAESIKPYTPTTPGAQTPPAPTPTAVSTAAFKNSSAYQALSQDLKGLVDLGFSTFSGTPEQQKIFTDALTNAQALADPYAKSQLALFKAEYMGQIAETTSDFKTKQEIIARTRDELMQDVASSKDYLTLEQQADIATTVRGYDEDLLTIADQAAEKGITFATGARSRALAEERRGSQFQDVIQSSRRKYNFQTKELELKAARGDTDAQKQLESLTANKGFELQKIGRAAESVLGSTGATGLGIQEFTPQTGSLGSVEQQRRESVIKLAGIGLPQ